MTRDSEDNQDKKGRNLFSIIWTVAVTVVIAVLVVYLVMSTLGRVIM